MAIPEWVSETLEYKASDLIELNLVNTQEQWEQFTQEIQDFVQFYFTDPQVR